MLSILLLHFINNSVSLNIAAVKPLSHRWACGYRSIGLPAPAPLVFACGRMPPGVLALQYQLNPFSL